MTKNKKQNKLALVLVPIIFFVPSDSLSMNVFGEKAGLLTQIIYFVVILSLFRQPLVTHNKNQTFFMITLLLFVYLTMFFRLDFSFGYIVQMLSLITGFMIVRKVSFGTFAVTYNKVLFYIAITSLVLFTLFLSIPSILDVLPITYNQTETPYVNLFFYSHYLWMFRNTGIFREPGVYIIYLNVAIIIELFYKSKPNRKHLLVYVISILTTLSTAGFIILALIMLSYILRNKSAKAIFHVVIFASVIVGFIVLNYELFETTLTKFNRGDDGRSGGLARISSFTVPLSIFIDSPFFGVGLSDFVGLYKSHSLKMYGIEMDPSGLSTNTLLNFLATYGLVVFSIAGIGYYKFSKIMTSSEIVRFVIFISLLMMLSNEDIRYSLLFSTLLFYGLSHKNQVIK